jgi:hypothetical protein
METINFDDQTSGPKEYNIDCCIDDNCPDSAIYLNMGASVAVANSEYLNCNTLGAINQFNVRRLGLKVNRGKVVNLSAVDLSKNGIILDLANYGINYILSVSVYTTNDIGFLFAYDTDPLRYKKIVIDMLDIPIPSINNSYCPKISSIKLQSCPNIDCLSRVEIMLVGY